jgi:hypothetical protein
VRGHDYSGAPAQMCYSTGGVSHVVLENVSFHAEHVIV